LLGIIFFSTVEMAVADVGFVVVVVVAVPQISFSFFSSSSHVSSIFRSLSIIK
jgi:hypothetical protein